MSIFFKANKDSENISYAGVTPLEGIACCFGEC